MVTARGIGTPTTKQPKNNLFQVASGDHEQADTEQEIANHFYHNSYNK